MTRWHLTTTALVGAALATVAFSLRPPIRLHGEAPVSVEPLRLLTPGQRALPSTGPDTETRLVAVLDVPVPPSGVAPARRLQGGGFDIDPELHLPADSPRVLGLELRQWKDGTRRRVSAPSDSWIHDAHFTANGKALALEVARPDGLHLWLVDPETGDVRVTTGARLSAVWGSACDWRRSADRVLCRVVPESAGPRGQAAPPPTDGVAEHAVGPEDRDAIAAPDFERAFSVQLAFIDLTTGRVQRIGRSGLYELADLAPGGQFILVGRTSVRGVSLVRRQELPRSLEVWTTVGAFKYALPAGPRSGPRLPAWDPGRPARLLWVEKAEDDRPGDAVMAMEPPFAGPGTCVCRMTGTIRRLSWSGNGALYVTEEEFPGRRLVTWQIASGGGAEPRKVWDSEDDLSRPVAGR